MGSRKVFSHTNDVDNEGYWISGLVHRDPFSYRIPSLNNSVVPIVVWNLPALSDIVSEGQCSPRTESAKNSQGSALQREGLQVCSSRGLERGPRGWAGLSTIWT